MGFFQSLFSSVDFAQVARQQVQHIEAEAVRRFQAGEMVFSERVASQTLAVLAERWGTCLLEDEGSAFRGVRPASQEAATDAYCYLCICELFWLMKRARNKPDLVRQLGVPAVAFIEHFIACLPIEQSVSRSWLEHLVKDFDPLAGILDQYQAFGMLLKDSPDSVPMDAMEIQLHGLFAAGHPPEAARFYDSVMLKLLSQAST